MLPRDKVGRPVGDPDRQRITVDRIRDHIRRGHERANTPTAVDIVAHLESNGGIANPDLRACSPSTEAGCVVGTDREGHPWRARCWGDVVHDHPLFTIDRLVFRTRAWRADAPS